MARKSGARIEAELFARIGLTPKAIVLPTPPVESKGTQADIDAWNKEKAKNLKKMPRELLTPELRKFLAYMSLKKNQPK